MHTAHIKCCRPLALPGRRICDMLQWRAVLSLLPCCFLLTYRRYTPEVGDVIVGRVTEVRCTGLMQATAATAAATHNNVQKLKGRRDAPAY